MGGLFFFPPLFFFFLLVFTFLEERGEGEATCIFGCKSRTLQNSLRPQEDI